MKKIFTKLLSLFSWEEVVKIFMKVAFFFVKNWIEAEELGSKQKALVRIVDAVNMELGLIWANETPTDVDNEFVGEVKAACVDIATKFGFNLYPIMDMGEVKKQGKKK